VNGTAGESVSLTCQERKLILESWMKSTSVQRNHLKVIAHIGSNTLQETIELA
jgi:dihydrodipicolinate synthase/N-acetylneuraminate lyase